MTSHIYMIIGTSGDKLEDIMRDMKKHTSTALKNAIKSNLSESRREWMLWMMERAGKKNNQNLNFQLWQQDKSSYRIIRYKNITSKIGLYSQQPGSCRNS